MKFFKYILQGTALLLPVFLNAFNEPGNLLKDFELNAPKEQWHVMRPVRRESIEAFQGLADTLYYLSGQGRCTIFQKTAVKPDTWYVASFLFRCDGKYASDGKFPCNVRAGFLTNGTDIWNGAKATRSFGGTTDWLRGQVFINSGKQRSLTPFIAFLGNGGWNIGRISLREITAGDFQNNAVLDGGFEKSLPGMFPAELCRVGKNGTITVTAEQAKSGKQALELNFRDRMRLLGGRFIVKSGDRFQAGIWLKASSPVFAELCVIGTEKEFKTKFVKRQKIGKDWTFLSLEGEVQKTADPINLLHFNMTFQSQEKKTVTVWGDDLTFVSVPPAAVRSQRRPRIWNDSFETGPYGWRIWFGEDPRYTAGTTRQISLDSATAGHGSHSLRIDKSKMPEELQKLNKFLYLYSMHLPLDNRQPYVFSFMAKASRPTTIRVSFPYKSIGAFKVTEKWQRFVCKPTVPGRWYGRPGFNEIRIHSPLDGSTVWLDALMLEQGEKSSPFRPAAAYETGIYLNPVYKIFPAGTKEKIQIMAVSYQQPLKGSLELRITDLSGQTVLSRSRKVSLETGKSVHYELPLPQGQFGYFVAGIILRDENRRVLAENRTAYAIVEQPRKIPYSQSWCGILGRLDNTGRNGSPAADLELSGGTLQEYLDVLELLGYKWIRLMGPGNWRNTEPARGKYQWKWDDYIGEIKKRNFGILEEFLSHDAQPWSNSGVTVKNRLIGGFNYTADPKDVSRFTADFARHYRGKIDSINLMNESNGYPAEEYVKIAKAVYEAYKKEAPEVIVQGPGNPGSVLPLLESPDTTWISRALALGLNQYNDVMGIHCYMTGHAHSLPLVSPAPPELELLENQLTFAENRRRQVEKFKKSYPHNRIWDTENGSIFNTVAPWMDDPRESRFPWYTERVAAARAVRWNILKMAMGVERNFYFVFKCTAGTGYHSLDLLNVDGTPRAGVAPLATFNRMLDGSRFIGCRKLNGTTHVYVFRDYDRKTVAVYWDPLLENRTPGVIRFPAASGITGALDFTGNPVEGKNGVYPLGDAPVYLKTRLSPEEFLKTAERAEVMSLSIRTALVISGNEKLPAFLRAAVVNSGTLPIKEVKLTLSDHQGGTLASLPARQQKTLDFPLDLSEKDSIRLTAEFQYDGRKQSASVRKRIFHLKSAGNNGVLDGQIGKGEYASKWSKEFIRTGRGQNTALSAELYGAWQPGKLRFAIRVHDSTRVTAKADEEVYRGDGIEFYLDFAPGKNPFLPVVYPDEAVRLSVNPAFPQNPVFERNGRKAVNAGPDFSFSTVKAVSVRLADGYLIELEIPVKTALYSGRLMGFNCCVMDHGNQPKPNAGLSLTENLCWNNVHAFELLRLE